MARPTKKQLEKERDAALDAMNVLEPDGSAKRSLAIATAMTRVWSLRFQIANRDYDEAAAADERSKRAFAESAMKVASTQLVEWEKRRSAAQSDLVNDLLVAEQEHTAEQDAIGGEFAALKKARDADR